MDNTVDVFVKSDGLSQDAIQGVSVSVVDVLDASFVAMATTGVDGKAAFLLPGTSDPGKMYELRLFKLGVFFRNPAFINVIDGDLNKFDASGTVLPPDVATDGRLCRCTGRFVNFSNQPIPNATVRVSAKADAGAQVPKVVDGNMVSADVMEFQTDDHGLLVVDLFRGGQYFVNFSGDSDNSWEILVPDRPSVNLIDLIHPKPARLDWDSTVAPDAAVSVKAGESVTVPLSLLFSDFEVLTEGIAPWISLTSSNDQVATVAMSADKAVITGMTPGQAAVVASLQPGMGTAQLPPPSLVVLPLVVTVTS